MEFFKQDIQDSVFDFGVVISVLDKLIEDALAVSGEGSGPKGQIKERRFVALAEAEAKKEAHAKDAFEASSKLSDEENRAAGLTVELTCYPSNEQTSKRR